EQTENDFGIHARSTFVPALALRAHLQKSTHEKEKAQEEHSWALFRSAVGGQGRELGKPGNQRIRLGRSRGPRATTETQIPGRCRFHVGNIGKILARVQGKIVSFFTGRYCTFRIR